MFDVVKQFQWLKIQMSTQFSPAVGVSVPYFICEWRFMLMNHMLKSIINLLWHVVLKIDTKKSHCTLQQFAELLSTMVLTDVVLVMGTWVGCHRLVVLLERKTYIHELGQLTILDTIDTVSNPRGSILCTSYYLKHYITFFR